MVMQGPSGYAAPPGELLDHKMHRGGVVVTTSKNIVIDLDVEG